jgi:hypothetical protein
MSGTDLSAGVGGRKLRFFWTDGATRGARHDHTFNADGTVEWRSADAGAAAAGNDPERPRYLDESVGADVRLVSYLSKSGYTLTVALNASDGSMTGVASNDKLWMPVRGTFEVLS